MEYSIGLLEGSTFGLLLDHFGSTHLSLVLMIVASFFMEYFSTTVRDQIGTLSQVGTSSYMAYAM